MPKVFNITADCKPKNHYMVNLETRLAMIKSMVDDGAYFTINRARQYGKTTILRNLTQYLQNDYYVVFMDFQSISNSKFEQENSFSLLFAKKFLIGLKRNTLSQTEAFRNSLVAFENQLKEKNSSFELPELFEYISLICIATDKPIVLIIDEVDNASNNQIFLDLLSQIRAYYIDRDIYPTFHSVILSSVYDIKNLKHKLRPEDSHKVNSPWITREDNEENECLHAFDECSRTNKELALYSIATDFTVDMSFSAGQLPLA